MNEQLLTKYNGWLTRFMAPLMPKQQQVSASVMISHGRWGLDAPYQASLQHPASFDGMGNLAYQEGDEAQGSALTPDQHQWMSVHDPAGLSYPILGRKEEDGAYTIVDGAQGRLNRLTMNGVLSPEDYGAMQERTARMARLQQQAEERMEMQQAQEEAAEEEENLAAEKPEEEEEPKLPDGELPDTSHPSEELLDTTRGVAK